MLLLSICQHSTLNKSPLSIFIKHAAGRNYYYSYLQIKKLKLQEVEQLALVILLRQRRDWRPGTLTPEAAILGEKDTDSRKDWGGFYHQGLHSSGKEGGGSWVYEMKPAGLTAENHVHFHKKDSAYLGQFVPCIFRAWRMKTGQLLFLGVVTGELRGLFP